MASSSGKREQIVQNVLKDLRLIIASGKFNVSNLPSVIEDYFCCDGSEDEGESGKSDYDSESESAAEAIIAQSITYTILLEMCY